MHLIKAAGLLFFALSSAISAEATNKKHIPISMGINLNEPQSQVNTVTHAQIMGDLAKSFRPFEESILKRVKESLEEKGVDSVKFESEDPKINNIFIDEYMDPSENNSYKISRNILDDQQEEKDFSFQAYQQLDDFKIRALVNRFGQKRYRNFSDYGVTVNKDRTVLLKKDSYVYTTGLESAISGDVPDGIYPLYFDGDVDVDIEGFSDFTPCPEKYPNARKCLDIKIPESPSTEGIKLTFTANSDTHLKNFHLIMPTVNHEDVLSGKIVFNPDYLEYIKPFSTFRVMNMLIASPKSPFECITTYVKKRDVYSLPKQQLVHEHLTHSVNIKLLEIIEKADLESIYNKSIDIEELFQEFKELKNKDNEIVYTEEEVEIIDSIIKDFMSEDNYLNIMTIYHRIKESEKALSELEEKLVVLRKKTLEFNWNHVNPDEDYGNCLMKFSRTSDNRAKLHDQFWGTSYITPEERWRGLPYEVIVALINKTKSNVWVNIPHNASIYYVSDMAEYFKENLHADSKIFLELSNEVWNGGFASQKYFIGLAKHRYEQYVTDFLDQFEQYLKTSGDKVLTYRDLRKGYLFYFNKYKEEIVQELENFKSCKEKSDFDLLVDKLRLTEKGLTFGEISKYKFKNYNTSAAHQIQSGATNDNNLIKELQNLTFTKNGSSLTQLSSLILSTDETVACDTLVTSDYSGTDKFIKSIKHKRGNFFEKKALEIPYLSAYWLGYTGAAKGKLKTQVEDKDGSYKYVFVDRFKYIKEHKSELHSPDLVYHYSGDEIRDLQKALFLEFKKGWDKRKKTWHFDFDTNAKIYVLKNLHRAYKIMAQMAYVERLDKIAKIWLDSGVNEENLIVTIATKQNNPNLTQSMLEYAKNRESIQRIDAIATSAYFFGCFGDLKLEDKTIKPHKFGPCKGVSKGVLNAKTADEIVDILKAPDNPKGIASIKEQMLSHKKVIDKIDSRIELVAAEGGHHLALTNMGRTQSKYIHRNPELKAEKLKLFQEAIEHEGMGELTKELYETWLDAGGKQFNNFYMPQTFHEWGSLGLSQSLSDMKTPRYRTASEYAPIFEKKEAENKTARAEP